MKIVKTSIFTAVALAATALFAASSSSSQVSHVGTAEARVGAVHAEGKAERCLPIRFEYKPGSALEKSLADHVESANAKLGVFLVEVRAGKKKDADLLKMAKAEFSGTYLQHPVLRMNDGKTVKGWEAIIPSLRTELEGMMYVNVNSVHASLEYIPARPESKSNIDFRAHIKTSLACAPTDCTWLEGEACHRNLCMWEPCPGGI